MMYFACMQSFIIFWTFQFAWLFLLIPSITATRSCKETRTTDMSINKIIDAVYYRSCSSHWLIRTALLTRASLQTFCHLLIRINVFVVTLVVLQYHYAFLIYGRDKNLVFLSGFYLFPFFPSPSFVSWHRVLEGKTR